MRRGFHADLPEGLPLYVRALYRRVEGTDRYWAWATQGVTILTRWRASTGEGK